MTSQQAEQSSEGLQANILLLTEPVNNLMWVFDAHWDYLIVLTVFIVACIMAAPKQIDQYNQANRQLSLKFLRRSRQAQTREDKSEGGRSLKEQNKSTQKLRQWVADGCLLVFVPFLFSFLELVNSWFYPCSNHRYFFQLDFAIFCALLLGMLAYSVETVARIVLQGLWWSMVVTLVLNPLLNKLVPFVGCVLISLYHIEPFEKACSKITSMQIPSIKQIIKEPPPDLLKIQTTTVCCSLMTLVAYYGIITKFAPSHDGMLKTMFIISVFLCMMLMGALMIVIDLFWSYFLQLIFYSVLVYSCDNWLMALALHISQFCILLSLTYLLVKNTHFFQLYPFDLAIRLIIVGTVYLALFVL